MGQRRLRYKGVPVGFLGFPAFNDNYESRDNKIKGRSKRAYLPSFCSDLRKNTPKTLLLIYDIPEGKKKERDWFRRQLINFNFVMIQRSVWVGPAPLPENFTSYLKRIGLQKEFKTFKLAKGYISAIA